MLLLTHIAIALSSLLVSAYLYVRPSRNMLGMSYGLVAATIVTGTALVILSGTHILEACTMGLIFAALSIYAASAAKHKLAQRPTIDG